MKLFWKAKPIIKYPVEIFDKDNQVIGKILLEKDYSNIKVDYLGKTYHFNLKQRGFTTPTITEVVSDRNEKIATIIDRQWLMGADIEIPNFQTFRLITKGFFSKTSLVMKNDIKIGTFNEKFWFLSPNGYLDMESSEEKNIPLIVSIFFLEMFHRSWTNNGSG